jgi:outer membrane biosynthesis protein TonB
MKLILSSILALAIAGSPLLAEQEPQAQKPTPEEKKETPKPKPETKPKPEAAPEDKARPKQKPKPKSAGRSSWQRLWQSRAHGHRPDRS